MLVESFMAMKTDRLVGDRRPTQQPQNHGRHSVTVCRQSTAKRQNVPVAAPANYLSAEAFLVLACVAVSLLVLPLILPPLPPPPPLLLLVPVCLLLLLAALATFVPSDTRSMTSSCL